MTKDLLQRTTFIRDTYRSLLNTGRSYAAFDKRDELFFKNKFEKGSLILDPMAGYGLLTRFCEKENLNSFNLEYNYPSYLWQILCEPDTLNFYINTITELTQISSDFPKSINRAVISDNFFPAECLDLLHNLSIIINSTINNNFPSEYSINEKSLALLLPFIGRLSCYVRGDNSTLIKSGGICVLNNWNEDFLKYLLVLKIRLLAYQKNKSSQNHIIKFGDARYFTFQEKFDGFFTSPPYPNHRDFVTIFKLEQEFLSIFGARNNSSFRKNEEDIIGTNFIRKNLYKKPESEVIDNFIDNISNLSRNSKATRDDMNYYIPYFYMYFSDLEKAYRNIGSALKPGAKGYIIVVNNTHRGLIVPLHEYILEIWKKIGFNSRIINKNEQFHIGTKNPRARGVRARHTRYELEISS